MKNLTKLELLQIITDLKAQTYLSKKDRELFINANKLILKKI